MGTKGSIMMLDIILVLFVCIMTSCGEKKQQASETIKAESSSATELEDQNSFADASALEQEGSQTKGSAIDSGEGEGINGPEKNNGSLPAKPALFSGVIKTALYDRVTDEVILDLSFSACDTDDHAFELELNLACGESLPASCSARLIHKEKGHELCEMLINKQVRLKLSHPVTDGDYKLKIIGENSFESLLISREPKQDYCNKESRVCSLEYRPHECNVEIAGSIIIADGGNQCGARWSVVDKVCDAGLSYLLSDLKDIGCIPTQDSGSQRIFSVSRLFRVSALTRGASFEALWDGRNLKISHINFNGKNSLEDRTSDIKPIIDAMNANTLPESDSNECQQNPAASYDGAHYISIQSGDYQCSGQRVFDLLYEAIIQN